MTEQRQADQLEPTYSSSVEYSPEDLSEVMNYWKGWQREDQGYLC